MEERPTLLMKIAPVVLSLFAGAALGFFYRGAIKDDIRPPASNSVQQGGMMGGGGGAGRGGGQPSSATALPRTIRSIATIEKVQNHGLSIAQSNKLLPLLEQLQKAEKLSEKDCDEKLKAIEAILDEGQKQALKDLQPARGGGGGGMMGGGGGAGRGGGMGGGGQDPEKPFASERNKQALEDLLSAVKSHAK